MSAAREAAERLNLLYEVGMPNWRVQADEDDIGLVARAYLALSTPASGEVGEIIEGLRLAANMCAVHGASTEAITKAITRLSSLATPDTGRGE